MNCSSNFTKASYISCDSKDNVMLGYILDIFFQVMEKKAIPVHPSCFTQLTTEHQKLTFVN